MAVCGLETEYGLITNDPGRFTQIEASMALLDTTPDEKAVPWSLIDESPLWDARSIGDPPGYAADRLETAADMTGFIDTEHGDNSGYLLPNGARLYIDHAHPEYSTPECSSPLDAICWDKAGEKLLARVASQFNTRQPRERQIELFKNNSDGKGNSYGCHENYTLRADTYENLFRNRTELLDQYLIPFLVTRQIIAGAGKVGSEAGNSPVEYQISQRADFLQTRLGVQTITDRPIVNTRDEAHSRRTEFRRLHLIIGDANMSEWSGYLKIGITRLLLDMIESEFMLPELELLDPLGAAIRISQDPECMAAVQLVNGRYWTAVEIQTSFADAALHYVERDSDRAGLLPLVKRWLATLEALGDDPMQLDRSLDWVIKRRMLSNYMNENRLNWQSQQIKALDFRYHSIDPQKSAYYLLEGRGDVDRILADEQIARATEQPPSDTRAQARAQFIEQMRTQGNSVDGASWRSILYHRAEESPHVQTFDRLDDRAAMLERE